MLNEFVLSSVINVVLVVLGFNKMVPLAIVLVINILLFKMSSSASMRSDPQPDNEGGIVNFCSCLPKATWYIM